MPGFDSVACGSSVLGSGAGEGTSICGCWSAFGGSACFGRSAQRAPRKTTSSTASSPITSFAAGLPPGPRAPGPATPGMAGISDLKRSDGGWSGISFVPILYTNRSNLTTDCPQSTEKGNVTSGPDVKTETNEDDLARSTTSAPLAFQTPKSPPSKNRGRGTPVTLLPDELQKWYSLIACRPQEKRKNRASRPPFRPVPSQAGRCTNEAKAIGSGISRAVLSC